ncbi:MAG: hypothetical protein ACKV2T_35895 [Kofleriaceae bacterium]
MFVPRTVRDFGELVMLFNEKQLAMRVDSEQQIVDLGPTRLQWDAHHPYLHFTRAIATMPPECTSAVERMIAAQNHAAQFPMLDFDASTGTLAGRMTALVLVDGVRVDVIEAILAAIDANIDEMREQVAAIEDLTPSRAR